MIAWIGFIDSFSKYQIGKYLTEIKLRIVKDKQYNVLIPNAWIVNLSTITFPKSMDSLMGKLKNKSIGTKDENKQV